VEEAVLVLSTRRKLEAAEQPAAIMVEMEQTKTPPAAAAALARLAKANHLEQPAATAEQD